MLRNGRPLRVCAAQVRLRTLTCLAQAVRASLKDQGYGADDSPAAVFLEGIATGAAPVLRGAGGYSSDPLRQALDGLGDVSWST